MEIIAAKVDKIIEKYKTNDPFKIAAYLDVRVSYENLGNILGYYNKSCRVKSILINENTSDGQKAFICCHELGHVILHPDSNTPFLKKNTFFTTDRIELEANFFAVQLLFSRSNFDGQLTIEDAIEHYGIPRKLIENNLTDKKFDFF